MTAQEPRDGAPTPPAGFWQRDEVRHALQDRDFGRVLRAYRKACGISQLQMVNILGVGSQSDVSRIERGRSGTDLTRLTQWAKTIQAPQDMLWFRLPGDASAASPTREDVPTLGLRPPTTDRGDGVHRRDFVRLAASTAALTSIAPWQRLADTLERGYAPDASTIRLLEDRTTEYFRTEENAPTSTIIGSLATHVAATKRLLSSTGSAHDRGRLLSIAGEAEALAGWLNYDQSQLRNAEAHYRRALELAQEAGDGPLIATVLNYRSYLLSTQDRTQDALAVLAEATQHVRGRSATTQAWIAGRHAEEAARLGDHAAAERSLDQAFTAYDYARPYQERSWTSFFVPSRLGSLAVSTYGRIQHPATDQLAGSLLTSLPPTNDKLRAIVLADLALSAVRNNDLDRADQLATEALPLALHTEGSMAQDRLWELTETLPPEGAGTADQLRTHITTTLMGSSPA